MKFNLFLFIVVLSPMTLFAGLKENIANECSIEKGLVDEWKGSWRSEGKQVYAQAKEAYDTCVTNVTERFKASQFEEEEVTGQEQNCAVKKLRGESCD